ncbi:MAG: hypothetical protein C0478_12650 [Planctomyces sp.]|nr:hypothetical protein [Planctomyces sp.]
MSVSHSAWLALVAIWVCFAASMAPALFAADPLLRITVDGDELRGQVIARDDSQCWFRMRDGAQRLIRMAEVSRYEVLPGGFRPMSTVELRDELAREWPGLRMASADGLIVAAPARVVTELKELFDGVRRDFRTWLRVHGRELPACEFPLVLVMPATREEFDRLLEGSELKPHATLAGAYFLESNRILLSPARRGEPPGERLATLVHEATHQLAFNLDVHSRIGRNPTWLVEGLAMAFENEALRTRDQLANPWERVNRERYLRLRAMQPTLRKGWLSRMIESDELFEADALGAYALSWGVTFHLMETRPRQYVKLLTSRAEEKGRSEVERKAARLAHFVEAVGVQPEWLEVEVNRYFEALGPSSR